ncbi:uncharacterized protein LOC121387375 [Gigantopelta aegis]|uniref:uncharacterized protein LOC121387375 n=1 Tax=Gigantopelta aegis TaxID=1735272 RepID=UPI001B887EC6|nr:uncharacterized protein LOC121387375 [Gigantopelta aegis]
MTLVTLSVFTLTLLGLASVSRQKVVYLIQPTRRIQTQTAPQACRLQKDAGQCRAALPRYFYNAYTSKCELFIYGGCGGNLNNFKTADSCFQSCACTQPPKRGSCQGGYLPRYYFNSLKGSCDVFMWSGCGSNDNNFGTKTECLSKCSVCSLPPDRGPCTGKYLRYYFQPGVGCRPFSYGGCQGNANNFLSGRDCVRHCFPNPAALPRILNTARRNPRVLAVPSTLQRTSVRASRRRAGLHHRQVVLSHAPASRSRHRATFIQPIRATGVRSHASASRSQIPSRTASAATQTSTQMPTTVKITTEPPDPPEATDAPSPSGSDPVQSTAGLHGHSTGAQRHKVAQLATKVTQLATKVTQLATKVTRLAPQVTKLSQISPLRRVVHTGVGMRNTVGRKAPARIYPRVRQFNRQVAIRKKQRTYIVAGSAAAPRRFTSLSARTAVRPARLVARHPRVSLLKSSGVPLTASYRSPPATQSEASKVGLAEFSPLFTSKHKPVRRESTMEITPNQLRTLLELNKFFPPHSNALYQIENLESAAGSNKSNGTDSGSTSKPSPVKHQPVSGTSKIVLDHPASFASSAASKSGTKQTEPPTKASSGIQSASFNASLEEVLALLVTDGEIVRPANPANKLPVMDREVTEIPFQPKYLPDPPSNVTQELQPTNVKSGLTLETQAELPGSPTFLLQRSTKTNSSTGSHSTTTVAKKAQTPEALELPGQPTFLPSRTVETPISKPQLQVEPELVEPLPPVEHTSSVKKTGSVGHTSSVKKTGSVGHPHQSAATHDKVNVLKQPSSTLDTQLPEVPVFVDSLAAQMNPTALGEGAGTAGESPEAAISLPPELSGFARELSELAALLSMPLMNKLMESEKDGPPSRSTPSQGGPHKATGQEKSLSPVDTKHHSGTSQTNQLSSTSTTAQTDSPGASVLTNQNEPLTLRDFVMLFN